MLVNRPNLSGNGAYVWRDQTIAGPGPRGSQLKLEVATLETWGAVQNSTLLLHGICQDLRETENLTTFQPGYVYRNHANPVDYQLISREKVRHKTRTTLETRVRRK